MLLRITPACAGKTKRILGRVLGTGDHPRVCGENIANPRSIHRLGGSPPRVRGKRAAMASWFALIGITPAHAGKTQPRCCPGLVSKDHPRACGENLIWDIFSEG